MSRDQYNNPLPVSCALMPILNYFEYKKLQIPFHKLLYVQRNIEPAKGKFALPGGYVDAHESFETAGKREVFEETGLWVNQFKLFNSKITPANTVLVFGITEIIDHELLADLKINSEVQSFKQEAISNLGFPTHQEVSLEYLNSINNKLLNLFFIEYKINSSLKSEIIELFFKEKIISQFHEFDDEKKLFNAVRKSLFKK